RRWRNQSDQRRQRDDQSKEFSMMQRPLWLRVWMRRVLGVAVFVFMVAMPGDWETKLLTKLSVVNTAKAGFQPALTVTLNDEGPLPELGGAVAWLNSVPLSTNSLRGKV